MIPGTGPGRPFVRHPVGFVVLLSGAGTVSVLLFLQRARDVRLPVRPFQNDLTLEEAFDVDLRVEPQDFVGPVIAHPRCLPVLPSPWSGLLFERVLFRERFAYVMQPACLTRPDLGEVLPGLGEAQCAVRAASNDIGVVFVLAVVLPAAHVTDLVVASAVECQVSAARACIRLVSFGTVDAVVDRSVGIPLEPLDPPRKFCFARFLRLAGHAATLAGRRAPRTHPLPPELPRLPPSRAPRCLALVW